MSMKKGSLPKGNTIVVGKTRAGKSVMMADFLNMQKLNSPGSQARHNVDLSSVHQPQKPYLN